MYDNGGVYARRACASRQGPVDPDPLGRAETHTAWRKVENKIAGPVVTIHFGLQNSIQLP